MLFFSQFLTGTAAVLAAVATVAHCAAVASVAAAAAGPEDQRSVRSPAVGYNNVLIRQRADPQIVKGDDGTYYFTATVPEYDRIVMRQAPTIGSLSGAPEKTIWARSKSTAGTGYVWAPELHRINGKWYVYFALGRQSAFDIRIFVLEGTGDNPMTARWTEKGFVKTDWDTFSLDASTFEVNGKRYMCWAQHDPTWAVDPDHNTCLMLAPMVNPWTLQLPAIAISRPDRQWERIGHEVNEGCYAIKRNGKVFVTYSAAATDRNYKMGLLTANENADLMRVSSWRKSAQPVFESNAQTNQWGPGHSAFTVSEDGQSDLLVYHARGYRDVVGEPLYNPDRHTRVQKLYWRADGTPDFGVPVPDGKTPVRLRSFVDQTLYVRQRGGVEGSVAVLQANAPKLAETQFRLVQPGLAGGDSVSLNSTSHPGSFLYRSTDGKLKLGISGRSSGFTSATASFRQVEGLADTKGVSFESVSLKGQYIRTGDNGELVVAAVSGDAQKGRATFYAE